MGQDIREMFRKEELENKKVKLNKGHQKRFMAKLDSSFPESRKQPKYYQLIKIAAVIVVALGVGFFFLKNQAPNTQNQIVTTPVKEDAKENKDIKTQEYRLSDVSPEFKKIEDYYMASLNIQLAKLNVNPKNKELIDAFMSKLEALDQEYKALNNEIQLSGLNEDTVEAMIANLQLRLELLKKLKNKLDELKQSKDNSHENYQA